MLRVTAMISIHAPAKGATICSAPDLPVSPFQSTLPRRERLRLFILSGLMPDFNPRSREGSDSAPGFFSDPLIHFNPRSREGSDHCRLLPLRFLQRFQSTLPRRERRSRNSSVWLSWKFQSTLPRRERLLCPQFCCQNIQFQSTLPRRERHPTDFRSGI